MKKKLPFLVFMAIFLVTNLINPVYAVYENDVQDEIIRPQSVDIITETEPNNSFEDATQVIERQTYKGSVSSQDSDVYRVTVSQKSMLYVFDGVNDEESYVWASIYNEQGDFLSVGGVPSPYYEINFSNNIVVEPGIYYIVYEADHQLSGEQEYSFSLDTYEGHINRLSGKDRYETAVQIAYRWARMTDNIILATGQDFPDALAAGPLSVQMNAPILLTQKNQIPDSVKSFIFNAEVKKVTIIGGTGVISQDVENHLKNVMGLRVERISGSNRFDTAVKIADRLENVSGVAYVVNGRNFPDALSISPVAAYEGSPILLTESNTIPSATSSRLSNYDYFYVIGGKNAVSENVTNTLGAYIRVSGNNRYETSVQVAEYFDYPFADTNQAYIATGTNFADALTGAPVAAIYPGPLILTPTNYLHEDAKNYFYSNDTIWFDILGGKSAIGENVESEIRSFIE